MRGVILTFVTLLVVSTSVRGDRTAKQRKNEAMKRGHTFQQFKFGDPLHASCKILNATSKSVLHYGECHGEDCSLGPLSYTHCDGTPMQAWFCKPGRRLLHVACKLHSDDSEMAFKRDVGCHGNAKCDFGPLYIEAIEQQVEATFCRPPGPEDGCPHRETGRPWLFDNWRETPRPEKETKEFTAEDLQNRMKEVGYGTPEFDEDDEDDDIPPEEVLDEGPEDWEAEMKERQMLAEKLKQMQEEREKIRNHKPTPEQLKRWAELEEKKWSVGGRLN